MVAALRRSTLGYANLEQVAMWLNDATLARTAIARWELLAQTAILADSHILHNQGEAMLLEHDGNSSSPVNLAAHAWLADGTNSRVHRGEKMHVPSIRKFFHPSP